MAGKRRAGVAHDQKTNVRSIDRGSMLVHGRLLGRKDGFGPQDQKSEKKKMRKWDCGVV